MSTTLATAENEAAKIEAQIVDAINADLALVEQSKQVQAAAALRIGIRCLVAKERFIPAGKFQAWLRSRFGRSLRTLQMYIAVAGQFRRELPADSERQICDGAVQLQLALFAGDGGGRAKGKREQEALEAMRGFLGGESITEVYHRLGMVKQPPPVPGIAPAPAIGDGGTAGGARRKQLSAAQEFYLGSKSGVGLIAALRRERAASSYAELTKAQRKELLAALTDLSAAIRESL